MKLKAAHETTLSESGDYFKIEQKRTANGLPDVIFLTGHQARLLAEELRRRDGLVPDYPKTAI